MYRNGRVEKKTNGARPPPKTGSHAVPAGLRSLFLMVMRGGGEREGGERSRLGHCGFPSLRSPPPCRAPSPLPLPLFLSGSSSGPRERFSAEQTKPAAAMRGEPGSARSGGQNGVLGWSVGPPGKRRGPLIPKRQAIPPHTQPPPQSRRSERHRLGGELVLGLLIIGGEPGGLWGEEVRRIGGWRERRDVGGGAQRAGRQSPS